MKIIHGSCTHLQLLLLHQQPLHHHHHHHHHHLHLHLHHHLHFSSLNHRFHRPIFSLTPNSHHSRRKQPLPTLHSLLDDSASGSPAAAAVDVLDIDPSLAVKKKATEISPELKGTSIFLVGMYSTMKTNLGKLLADTLRYYYFDSDSLVAEAAGGSSAKSLKENDEEGFRESETEVLKQLSSLGRLVVCAGNGAVQSTTNLALMRHGISIWVDVPLDMVTRGVVADDFQLSGSSTEVKTQLTAVYEEMRGGYATADATISLQKVAWQLGYDELDAVTTEDMTLEVLKEIERLTRVKKMMAEAARPF